MMKKRIRILTVGLLCLSMLSGCGKKVYEAPELIEPTIVNESYRPVEYGNIGSISMELKTGVKAIGTVVPVEKSYFWPVGATIDEIKVKEGDYVEAGTVLATANLEDANDVLSDLSANLSLENQVFEQNEQIYNYDHEELLLKIDGAKSLGQSTADLEKQLAILEENHSYDVKLHNFNVSQINKSIAKQREFTSDATLVADKSGYVTYVRSIVDSNKVSASDAVVVIADYDDLYIQMDISISKQDRTFYGTAEHFYAFINGERYELFEYEYSPEELAVAESKGVYPKFRLQLEDRTKLPEIGQNIIVYLYRKVTENVLIVGNDSVYTDDEGYYVFVLENGENVKRRIEIGAKDDHYTEVTSGLEEGEMVQFTTMISIPTDYATYTCTGQTYTISQDVTNTKIVTTSDKVFYSEYEGIVQTIDKKDGEKVTKGELICTLKTNDGSARLSDMATSISNFKEDHQKAIDALDTEINNIQLTIDGMDAAALADDVLDDDTSDFNDEDSYGGEPEDPNLRRELELELNKLNCLKQIENLNYNRQLSAMNKQYQKMSCNNNGNGVISIYADRDGMVTDIKLHEGKVLKDGDRMFDIRCDIDRELWINPFIDLTANQKINFYDKETQKSYTGIVVGGLGNSPKMYFDLIKDKMYITYTAQDRNKVQYKIQIDDESFFDADLTDMEITYEYAHIENAILVPRNAVYKEVYEEEEYLYTWRVLEDGTFVKQYIELLFEPDISAPYVCVLKGLKEGDVVAVLYGIGVDGEEEGDSLEND